PFFFSRLRLPPTSTLFPYTTLFRSSVSRRRPGNLSRPSPGGGARKHHRVPHVPDCRGALSAPAPADGARARARRVQSRVCLSVRDRKSTRLNSSHVSISYAVFCLKK